MFGLTEKELKEMSKRAAELRTGVRKPAGLTMFEKLKGKTIQKRWRSIDGMIIERVLDEKTNTWKESAKYPGSIYWCSAKKCWGMKKTK